MNNNKNEQNIYFWQGAIFRKILIIFVVLSFVPLVFLVFLTVSSYQGVMEDLQNKEVLTQSEISRLKQNVYIQIFLVFFLLVIFIVFASVLIDKNITRPLLALVQGVKEVTGGNLDVKFQIKSKDEFGTLASTFNEMITQLKEQRERDALGAKLKSEFMSIAAHQLRTPLSSMKWILRMLLDGDMGRVSLQQRDFIEKAYGSGERMIALVNDLLDVTRIEEGRFGFEFSGVDFNKLVEEMTPYFKQQARIKNVDFTYKPCKDPLLLIADQQRIKIVLTNLIDNAMHYTPTRGSVELAVNKKDGFVQISVKDTGIGIPEQQKSRIFSKFFRGDNVVKMQAQGTGLGLFLSKNITEKHGGRMWFESEENKGSTFYFTLPDKKDEIDLFADEHA